MNEAKKDEVTNPTSEVHTYPDGTQVVGVAPFPAKSPKEGAPVEVNAAARMYVPPGVKTSGQADAVVADNSPEAFRAKVDQQLKSDIASGKSPDTPNPTTSSDKPQLANMVTANSLESINPEPTAEDLERMAKSIKADGATDDEVEAAVIQVARETPGAIPTKATKGKK